MYNILQLCWMGYRKSIQHCHNNSLVYNSNKVLSV